MWIYWSECRFAEFIRQVGDEYGKDTDRAENT